MEIVSTIKSYNAILIEIDLKNQLLLQYEKIDSLHQQQLMTKDKLIFNLESQIQTWRDQVNVQNKALRKEKAKTLFTGGVGVATIVLMLILK